MVAQLRVLPKAILNFFCSFNIGVTCLSDILYSGTAVLKERGGGNTHIHGSILAFLTRQFYCCLIRCSGQFTWDNQDFSVPLFIHV